MVFNLLFYDDTSDCPLDSPACMVLCTRVGIRVLKSFCISTGDCPLADTLLRVYPTGTHSACMILLTRHNIEKEFTVVVSCYFPPDFLSGFTVLALNKHPNRKQRSLLLLSGLSSFVVRKNPNRETALFR